MDKKLNKLTFDHNFSISELEEQLNNLKLENETLKQELALKTLNEDIFSLKEIVNFLPGNIFWKDKNGKYLGCNKNHAALLGFDSPDEIIGKYNIDIPLINNVAHLLDKKDQQIMLTGEGEHIEEFGLGRTFLSHKIPYYNRQNKVIGLLGISIDITQQKELEKSLKAAKEEAEASNRAKSQFLAVVNHELRTPLTCIVGLLDLLKRDKLPEADKKNMLDSLESCSQQLLNLVNELLDFSKLEKGKYEVHPGAVSVMDVVQQVISVLRVLATSKGLNLHLDSAQDLPTIETDPSLLRQILLNLINNAIKFTDKGEVVVNISSSVQNDRLKLIISVSDTGPGIPADKIKTIFQPFKQLEDTYERKSSRSGTGLGLAIVNEMAKMIQAKIKVTSEIGKGSVFSLMGNYPLSKSPLPENLSPMVNQDGLMEKIAGTKVLLIEDDPIISYVHKQILEEFGCKVDRLFNGRAIMDFTVDHDIAFVDLSLPDLNGFEVIKHMRKISKMPIIALTAYSGEEQERESLEAGANLFKCKPISRTELAQLLGEYLD